jgi:hypothetical protein
MGKQLVAEEIWGLHRVWNFVVPFNKVGNNGNIQSIPPLNKSSFRKKRKRKARKSAC